MEPSNPELILSFTAPLVRLAHRKDQILDVCRRMIERAIQLAPKNSELHTELGYILFLKGDLTGCFESFKQGSSFDPHNVEALEGLIRWQIFSGHISEAEEQLVMFNELQSAMGSSAHIAYLNGSLTWKKTGDLKRTLNYLNSAIKAQIKLAKDTPLSLYYYRVVNPDFLLEVAGDYLDYCESGNNNQEDLTSYMQNVQDILDLVSRVVSGSNQALFMMAKVKLLLGDTHGAELRIAKSLQKSNANPSAHLLLAEIQLANNNFTSALSSLEMALSFDFEIRHNVNFHILKAKCLKKKGDLEEAVRVLVNTLSLPAVKEGINGNSFNLVLNNASKPRMKNTVPASSTQIASIYLEAIEANTSMKNNVNHLT